jgi:hypothetical protein
MPSSNFDDIFSSIETMNSSHEKSEYIEKKISELRNSEKLLFNNVRKLSRLEILNERLKLHENLHVEKVLLMKLHGLKNSN